MGKDAGRLLYWAIGKFIAMRSRHARHSALCSKDIEAISTRPTVTHSELQKLLGFCESTILISQVLPFAGLMSQPGSLRTWGALATTHLDRRVVRNLDHRVL